MSRHGMVLLLAAVLAVVPMAGCAKAPRSRPVKMGDVDTGKGTLTAARKYLEGRWSLLSYEVYPPNADPITLKGAGTLTYDDYSNLDIQIRTDAETAALLDKAGIKNDAGTISTSGRVVVDMVQHTMTYVIEGQPKVGEPGGPLALNRPRHWEVAGNVLTLTTRGDDGKPLSVGKWQKME
jgi:hypothetical protein